MRTYAILVRRGPDAFVENLLEAESSAALVRVFPDVLARHLDVTAFDPRPNVGDRFTVNRNTEVVTFVAPPTYPAPVGPAQVAAHARVNAECGVYRKNFITDITAQETTYQAKYAEVKQWDADEAGGATPQNTPTHYPYLNAEAIATGKTILEVKTVVKYLGGIWYELGARIEGKRLGMHTAIDACTTVEEVAALFPIQWPTP